MARALAEAATNRRKASMPAGADLRLKAQINKTLLNIATNPEAAVRLSDNQLRRVAKRFRVKGLAGLSRDELLRALEILAAS